MLQRTLLFDWAHLLGGGAGAGAAEVAGAYGGAVCAAPAAAAPALRLAVRGAAAGAAAEVRLLEAGGRDGHGARHPPAPAGLLRAAASGVS